jgi:N-sulfoglucosamine sulfohydrolase
MRVAARASRVWGVFVLLFPVAVAAGQRTMLFAFADDWGRYASLLATVDGPGGINDVVQTPNFDAIACRGVFFCNSHVSAPCCTPCRSSLLTDRHLGQTGSGSILQGAVYDDTISSFPPLLRDAGYLLGYSHKVWSPGTPVNPPHTQNDAFHRRGGAINQVSQTVTKHVA